MLPIKLTLQGINSYQKEQTIDFTNLVENQIFGIFGEVGSGKSTIPEAISFALYGKTDRLSRNDGISYNLMNLKSERLLIDFEFRTQNEGFFRFVVKGKRNSKNFEDVSFEKMKYEKNGNEWIPNEKLEAEEILGLSYDNFKRTIIIPQNKFMDFIQLSDSDRTRMLQEIFNLGKYDLYRKTSQLEIKANLDKKELEGEYLSFSEIDNESLNEKKLDLNNFKEKKNIVESEFKIISLKYQEQLELQKLHIDLVNAQGIFTTLENKREEINTQTKELNEYKICLYNFKGLIDSKMNLINKLNSDRGLKQKYETEFAKLSQYENELKSKLSENEEDYKNIDNYNKELEDLKKLMEIKKNEENTFQIQLNLTENQIKKSDAETKLNTVVNQLEEAKSTIKQLEKDLPDIQLLTKVKEWFFIKSQIKINIEEIKKNISGRKSKIKEIDSQKVKILTSKHLESLSFDISLNISEIIEKLKNQISWYSENLKKINSEIEELRIKLKLKEFSSSLKEGIPCPVCGSLNHPDPLIIENVEVLINTKKERIEKGELLINEINILIDNLNSINAELVNEQRNIDDLEYQLENKNHQLISHESNFNWEEFDSHNPETIEIELSKAEILKNRLKIFRDETEKLESGRDILYKNFERLKQENTDLNSHFNTKIAEKKLLLSQIKLIQPDDYANENKDYIKNKFENLILFIEKIKNEHQIIDNDIKENEKLITQIKINIQSISKNIDENELDLNDILNQLDIKLHQYKFDSEDQVEMILLKNLNIDIIEDLLNEFNLSYINSKSEIEKLNLKIGDRKFDEIQFNELKSKIENTNILLDEIQLKIGGLTSEIEDWEKKLKRKEILQKEIDKLELRIEDLKVMLSLFKGSGFVNFVSKIKLKELINYANSRFNKLSRGRLSMQLSHSNSFDIIDYLNDGKRRSIKSLSGGQLFQASLSLALALAGLVQSQNKSKQNFFFLDEGFGTQDEQALQLVFEAISSLRNENRVVGLISHVAEMKESIYAYLDVVNDDIQGSLISNSWEK